ncbi:MAG: hypothetical protein KZQ78_13200 [Candidatus Thiodiazotropha sp. (ex Ustalcina ferruginea)]|nr:hypothetical protein [Candidatus Thiodiazotropha sp. (ex Ustalcina ferruginea)]
MKGSSHDSAFHAFRQSELVKDAFGSEFGWVFSENRRMRNEEYNEYLTETGRDGEMVTDWELRQILDLSRQ